LNDERHNDDLHETLDGLKRSLKNLEARVATLEGSGEAPALPADPSPPVSDSQASTEPFDQFPGAEGVTAGRILFQLGRSILVLAGAFLLRALTDGQTIPPIPGFLLGSSYALGLILMAYRGAGRGDRLGAGWWGVTAALVAYPFLLESTGILKLVPPLFGALALTVISAAGVYCSWRRSLRFLAWAYVAASLGTALLLGAATDAPLPFTYFIMMLGMATVLLAYSKGWHFKRWVVALTANAMVVKLTREVLSHQDHGAADGRIPAEGVLILALVLLVSYLGVFIYRALVQGRGVKIFDVVQSGAVVLIGFGSAVRIARDLGSGEVLLGWAALAASLAGYTVAFTLVRRRLGRGRWFFYFATLALVFLYLGSRTVAGPWLVWCWILLGLVTAFLGGYFKRVTLQGHSLVYLTLGAVSSGLVPGSFASLIGSTTDPGQVVNPASLVSLGGLVVAYLAAVRSLPADLDNTPRRIFRFGLALLGAMGLVGLTVVGLVQVIGTEAVRVAVCRTGVLALGAIMLSFLGRRPHLRELGWLAYLMLTLGLAKLVVEDLRLGDPLALFLAFGMFGTSLILVPRILRSGREARTPDSTESTD